MSRKNLFTKERIIVLVCACVFPCLLCLYIPLVVETLFPFQLASMLVLAVIAGPLLAGLFDGSAEYFKQTIGSIALAAIIGSVIAVLISAEVIHAYVVTIGMGLGAFFFYPMYQTDNNGSMFTCFYLITTAVVFICATFAAILSVLFTDSPMHYGWTIVFGAIITLSIGWISMSTGHEGNLKKIGSAMLGALIPTLIVPAALGCSILLSAIFAAVNMLIIFLFYLAYKPKKARA